MGRTVIAIHIVIMVLMMIYADAWDTNPVFNPCSDAKFTFALAFSTKESHFQSDSSFNL